MKMTISLKKCLSICALALVISLSATGCKAFRKKNKCNTCPTWDSIELSQNLTPVEK